ncbi:MAG: hypothetical protein H8E66_32130 [Planctomycetes bacterium]|nr:hypothetical protein [Planctomycetota bacterium]
MSDATSAMFWMTATVALGGSAFVVSKHWFPRDRFAATAIHVTIMCWGCVVGVTLLLGVQGLLMPGLLMLCVVVCAVFGVWIVRGDDTEATVGRNKPSQLRHIRRVTRPPEQRKALFRPTLLWGVVASILAARVTLHGLLRLPADWDTLAYHLPLLSHWAQTGTLYAPDCAFGYVPGNNEILGLWVTAPFSGDFLIHLNNILPAILLAAASFELCVLLGVIQPVAHLCAVSVISTRPMFRQLVSAENDLAVAALFLATLVYAIRFAKHERSPDVWLAATTFGLLIGIKYYAIGYAAVAGLGLLGLVWAIRGGRMAIKATTIGLTGAVFFGGYWYVRNVWHYGGPLFPKSMIGDTSLWDEMRPDSHTSSLLPGSRLEVWTLLARAVFDQAGPIALLAMLLLPASVAWCVVSALQKERSREARAIRLMLAGVMFLTAIVYCITPNVIETKVGTMNMLLSKYHPVRFGLGFLSTSMIGMALASSDMLQKLSVKHLQFKLFGSVTGTLLVGHWIVGAVWQFIQHASRDTSVETLLLACNMGLVVVVVYLCWTSRSSAQRAIIATAIACCVPLAVGGIHLLSQRWHTSFNNYYDRRITGGSLEALATLDPTSERICICDSRYYPFFGVRHQFDVCRPLWFRNSNEFLQYVKDQRVTVLVIRTSSNDAPGRYTAIRPWILAQPHIFHTLSAKHRYTMFRVVRDVLHNHPSVTKGQPTT